MRNPEKHGEIHVNGYGEKKTQVSLVPVVTDDPGGNAKIMKRELDSQLMAEPAMVPRPNSNPTSHDRVGKL